MNTQKGTLFLKYDKQQVTDKFSKLEFVLELGDKYKEYPKFQLVNDNCKLLDNIQVGQQIEVSYNLKGKPYQGKTGETTYFTNLDVWKVELVGTTQQAPPPTQKNVPPPKKEIAPQVHADLPNSDDLPF